jgi:large repetitive protein
MLHSWWKKLGLRRSHMPKCARSQSTCRLQLEVLEGRVTPSQLTVSSAPPTISTPANMTAYVNTAFTDRIFADSEETPIFTLTAAPAGMAISRSGLISWTPTLSAIGTQTVTVQAADSTGSASATFTVSVPNPAPVFTITALPNATAGAPYSVPVTASAGTAPGIPAPTISLVSGPTGLTMDPTGVISWMPTTSQIGTQSVTVQASNSFGTATQTFPLTVTTDLTPPTVPQGLAVTAITTTSLTLSWSPSTDNVGVAGYRLFFYTPGYVSGHSGRGGGGTYIPPKYTLVANNITATTYTLTGLKPGTNYDYVVAAFDAAGNVSGYSNSAPAETWLLPTVTWYTDGVHADPSISLVANHSLYMTLFAGGNPAPTMSYISGPDGAVFNPGQITNSQLTTVIPNITWTPTEAQVGVNYITMEVANSAGTVDTVIPVTVTADVPVPSLSVNGGLTYTMGNMTTSASNPNAYQLTLNPGFNSSGTSPQFAIAGTPFSFQLTGTSNTNPTTYSLVSGPAGMTVDPNTGLGTWTPGKSDAGNTSVTVAETNSAGTSTLTFIFPTYFTDAPTNVTVGFLQSVPSTSTSSAPLTPIVSWTAPTDTTGLADYKITVTNALTGAVTTFDTQSTTTSYSLTGVGNNQFFVNVTAYDANGNPSQTSATASLYMAAVATLGWTFSSPSAVAGSPLTIQFSGSGMTYSIVSGPTAAAINATTGLLSWTPSQSDVGTGQFVVAAANPNGWGTIYATLSIPVKPAPAPASNLQGPIVPLTTATTVSATLVTPTADPSKAPGDPTTVVNVGSTTPAEITNPATSTDISTLSSVLGTNQVATVDQNGDPSLAGMVVAF